MADSHRWAELHCWAGRGDDAEIGSDEWIAGQIEPSTCMLPRGHDGPHVWTRDEEITVTFQDRPDGV